MIKFYYVSLGNQLWRLLVQRRRSEDEHKANPLLCNSLLKYESGGRHSRIDNNSLSSYLIGLCDDCVDFIRYFSNLERVELNLLAQFICEARGRFECLFCFVGIEICNHEAVNDFRVDFQTFGRAPSFGRAS